MVLFFHCVYASQNMRTINKKRTEMLAPIMKTPETEQEEEERIMQDFDYRFSVNGLAHNLLLRTFSYKEKAQCNNCLSVPRTIEVSILDTNEQLLSDFSNLIDAVLQTFPDRVCVECRQNLSIESEFGQFIYIQVIII